MLCNSWSTYVFVFIYHLEILYPQQTYSTPKKRFQWGDELVYTICTLSLAIDVSNILSFPYLLMEHGGGSQYSIIY